MPLHGYFDDYKPYKRQTKEFPVCTVSEDEAHPNLQMSQAIKSVFGDTVILPKKLFYTCGAQFACSKDTITTHSKSFYERVLGLHFNNYDLPFQLERMGGTFFNTKTYIIKTWLIIIMPARKPLISKKLLYDLYVNKRMPVDSMTKHLLEKHGIKIARETLYKQLKTHKIKLRGIHDLKTDEYTLFRWYLRKSIITDPAKPTKDNRASHKKVKFDKNNKKFHKFKIFEIFMGKAKEFARIRA